jgi:DNA-binding Lrp family transcriptional regulator
VVRETTLASKREMLGACSVFVFVRALRLENHFDEASIRRIGLRAGRFIHENILLIKYVDLLPTLTPLNHTDPNFELSPAVDNYSSFKMQLSVYFRDVNQSDPLVQDEMREYIEALSELPQVRQAPDFCWVRDLHAYMTGEATAEMDEGQARQAQMIATAVQSGNKTFAEQLDILLNIPMVREVYGGDIVRDEAGNIVTSRCLIFVRHVDLKSIQEQTQLLYDQRQVTALYQPKIDGQVGTTKRGELSFFAFDEIFYYWELVSYTIRCYWVLD